MSLADYPTPETDAAAEFRYGRIDEKWVSVIKSRDLERRLAACREALVKIANCQLSIQRQEELIIQTLTETAPK
jgi:hypothetical protein